MATRSKERSELSSSDEWDLVAVDPREDEAFGLPDIYGWEPVLKPFLEKVCARSDGMICPADILQLAYDELLYLWVIVCDKTIHGFIGTVIQELPRMRVAKITLAASEPHTQDKWLGITLQRVEEWAREEECSILEIEGRAGWAKFLPEPYKPAMVTYRREI